MSAPIRLVIVGGGQHACVVLEAAHSRPDLWEVLGFTDPEPGAPAATRLGARWLGDDDAGLRLVGGVSFVLGVGAVGVSPLRAMIAARYDQGEALWGCVVHKSAWVSPSARLGRGVVVLAGATVNSGARVGDHCVVNTCAIVEHDVQLGAFVQVAPGACLGGGAAVAAGSYLGLGCCVRDRVRIGSGALVGMGAVVTRSVAANEVVLGVPAKPIR